MGFLPGWLHPTQSLSRLVIGRSARPRMTAGVLSHLLGLSHPVTSQFITSNWTCRIGIEASVCVR
jgi:hypothetical protein